MKWEYKYQEMTYGPEGQMKTLNELGSQGWEVIAIREVKGWAFGWEYILKRRTQEENQLLRNLDGTPMLHFAATPSKFEQIMAKHLSNYVLAHTLTPELVQKAMDEWIAAFRKDMGEAEYGPVVKKAVEGKE